MKKTSEITVSLRKEGVAVTSKPYTEIPSLRKGIIILYYSGGLEKFQAAVTRLYPDAELKKISAFIPTTDFS